MEYKRNCPDCDKELSYTDKSNFRRAIRNNSVCANCRKMPESLKKTLSEYWTGRTGKTFHRRKNPPKNFERQCPQCNVNISYVNKYNFNKAIEKNTICPKCVAKNKIEKYGTTYKLSQDQINKMAATKAGYDSFDEYMKKLPEFKKYKRNVMSITYKQPLKTLKDYDKKGKMGVEGAFNIDHIYSIHKGFINGIEPKIIGNIKNLKMIPWLENIKKHKN